MSNICIIPARGKSKRIKNKNIRKFNDLPMISFAIKAALESNLFEHIVVSTDNNEIIKIHSESRPQKDSVCQGPKIGDDTSS